MKYSYSEFDDVGRFLSPDDLFPSSQFVEFILQHGQDGLEALDQHPDEQLAAMIAEMIEAGLLERDEDGTLSLTPRMLRGMQHRSFLEIFRNLKPGVQDGHEAPETGSRGDRTDGTRAYTFGDPLSEIAMGQTMRNAMQRTAAEQRRDGRADEAVLPLKLRDDDVELFNVEATTDTAMCIVVDLSGSMMRYGRHIAAKRVALGMQALVREKFPLDTIDYVGFASTAESLAAEDLPMVMPKPITTRDWEVRVRCPLDQAHLTHPHFTNLQHALRLARLKLSRRGAPNKQIFLITDGQPTAHLSFPTAEGGFAPLNCEPSQTILNLVYPPSEASSEATLTEAHRCMQAGIRISSFALIEEYYGMDWVGFIDQMTRLVRGVAFYCTAGDLGATIMESYLTGKRQKRPLG
jgi:Ca-activated chloride channel family protein